MILIAQSTTAGDFRVERCWLSSIFFTLPSGSSTKRMTMSPLQRRQILLRLVVAVAHGLAIVLDDLRDHLDRARLLFLRVGGCRCAGSVPALVFLASASPSQPPSSPVFRGGGCRAGAGASLGASLAGGRRLRALGGGLGPTAADQENESETEERGAHHGAGWYARLGPGDQRDALARLASRRANQPALRNGSHCCVGLTRDEQDLRRGRPAGDVRLARAAPCPPRAACGGPSSGCRRGTRRPGFPTSRRRRASAAPRDRG